MPRSAIACLCAVLLAPAAVAQVGPVTKGSRADLRGATVVYVDTAYDSALERLVVEELAKQMPDLVLAEAPEQAQLVLQFNRASRATKRGSRGFPSNEEKLRRRTDPDYQPVPRNLTLGTRDARETRPMSRSGAYGNSRLATPSYEQGAADTPAAYALGSVLKPDGMGGFREVFDFKQPVWRSYDRAVKSFVKKFAKEYRKENETK